MGYLKCGYRECGEVERSACAAGGDAAEHIVGNIRDRGMDPKACGATDGRGYFDEIVRVEAETETPEVVASDWPAWSEHFVGQRDSYLSDWGIDTANLGKGDAIGDHEIHGVIRAL